MTVSATEIASIHQRLASHSERIEENNGRIANVESVVRSKIGNGKPGALEMEIESIKKKTDNLQDDVTTIKDALKPLTWVSQNWTRVAIAVAALVGGSGTISATVQTVLQVIIEGMKGVQ